MLIIKIAAVILIIYLVLKILSSFDRVCYRRFERTFFTGYDLVIVMLISILMYVGNLWREAAISNNGDALNGIILMSVSVLLFCSVIFLNFKSTKFDQKNLLLATIGSISQVIIYALTAIYGWVAAILLIVGFAILMLLSDADAPAVRIVD